MSLAETLARHKHKIVPGLVLGAAIVAALVYRQQLGAWFGGAAPHAPAPDSAAGKHASGHSAGDDPAQPAAKPFDDATLTRLGAAFEAYEQVRRRLSRDSLESLDAQAKAIAAALSEAKAGAHAAGAHDAMATLQRAHAAANELAAAADLATARKAFSQLSEPLVALANRDPRLREGFTLFECPMAEGFPKWLQHGTEIENPYMGQQMLTCGSQSPWQATPPAGAQTMPHGEHAGHTEGAGDDGEIAYYTCAMHPSVRQDTPGKCPICGMELTPVTKGELASGTIVVDAARRQRIGVRTAPAQLRAMQLQIRAVGEVKYDESRLSDVNLRIGGWVQKLLVDETGQRVRAGQTLFTLYSPELYAAQLEHLSASARKGETSSSMLQGLARTSAQRLRLLGMSDSQIAELEQRGSAWEYMPIVAPAGGYVVDKNVVEGARIEAGSRVYRIADLSHVWIDAEIYESDLPHVRAGQAVTVRLPYVPGRSFEGTVDYVYPSLEGDTRTGRARIVLANKKLELKPQMYADVEFAVDLGERLAIPDSAVIFTGPRRLVFVDLGQGRLQPREVELGVHAQSSYEVTSGLSAGDVVVSSGNFLIAAESRIRSATEYWGAEHAGH